MEKHQVILQRLLKLPNSHQAGQDEIRLKCPICKHHNDKLYIGLNRNLLPKKILSYECKHCGFHGNVNNKFLKYFEIENLSEDLFEKYDPNARTTEVNSYTKVKKMNLEIPNYILPEDEYKMDYLQSRFIRKFTIEDIQKYKFVLNFNDFCKYNDFDPFQFIDPAKKIRNKYIYKDFSDNFIGILSMDNNKISFRNLRSEMFKDKRYMVYVINKNITNPYMYIPNIPFDILTPSPVINLAEGAYDIIGAKELLFIDDDYSNIFAAIGNRNAYVRVLKEIMKFTGFIDANINIFADNDGEEFGPDYYRAMFKEIRPILNKVTLYFNMGYEADKEGNVVFSKDFGNLSKPIDIKRILII